jgi:hypothetical protein
MGTVKLMLSEFMNHLKNNFVTALLMSVVSLILIIFMSIYLFQVSKLKPFKALNIERGFFSCYVSNFQTDELEEMEGVENIYYFYNGNYISEDGENFGKIIGYDEWVWENYTPILNSGEWFSNQIIEACENEGSIPIIISGNTGAYKVGDVIGGYLDYDYYSDEKEKTLLSMKVIGMVTDDTGIIGDDGSYSASDMSYESLFRNASDFQRDDSSQIVIILPLKMVNEKGLSLKKSYKFFIKYSDSLSSEEADELDTYFYRINEGSGITMSEFMADSEEKIRETILEYVPFIIIGIMILAVSMYSLTYLTVAKCSSHLAVYMLIGASKKKNYLILLGNTIGTIMLSAILFVIELQLYKSYAYSHQAVFMLKNGYELMVVIAYLVFFLFMSASMFMAFRKKTTRGLLISLHK